MSTDRELIRLCQGSNYAAVVGYLRKKPVSFKTLNYAFLEAVKANNISIASILLRRGVQASCENNTAICFAVQKGFIEMIRFLLDNGADVNARNGFPLITAYKKKDLNLILMLVIEYGANTTYIYGPKKPID